MANESQSTVQKTDEELFNEIIEARQKGEDVGKLLENVEIVSTDPIVEGTEPEEVEDPATTVVPDSAVKEGEEEQPATPAAKAPVSEEDWLAGLPAEAQEKVRALKEERQQLERDNSALRGRVPYLNRKVDELQRLMSTRPAPEKAPAAPATSVAEGKFATKLAEARAVDPALAELLEAMRDEIVHPLREEIATKTSKTENALREQEEMALWQSEKAKLLERIPQADEVFRHPLYKEWKKTLPENQLRLASSIYADDVEIALGQFAKYAAAVQPELAAPVVAAPVAAPAATSASTQKVVADRARKLAAGNPGTATPAPKTTREVEDPEVRFALITERIRQGKSYTDLV